MCPSVWSNRRSYGRGLTLLPLPRRCCVRKRLAVLVATSVLAGAAVVVAGAGPAAAAPSVTDEAGFRMLWGNPGQTGFVLGADITFVECKTGVSTRNSATALRIIG